MSPDATAGAISTTRVEAICGYLDGAGVAYDLIEHTRVESAADEARTVERSPAAVAKTIVLRDGNAHVIAAISAADRLDLHKLRALLDASRRQLRLASEEEIARDFPSLEVGAIPPFGPMVPVAEVLDRALMSHERVLCPAGDHRHSVLVETREIVRLTAARIADIRED